MEHNIPGVAVRASAATGQRTPEADPALKYLLWLSFSSHGNSTPNQCSESTGNAHPTNPSNTGNDRKRQGCVSPHKELWESCEAIGWAEEEEEEKNAEAKAKVIKSRSLFLSLQFSDATAAPIEKLKACDYKASPILVEMSTSEDELLCMPVNYGKVASASAADEQRSDPERQVCSTPPGIAALTDNTKRFKLSSSQEQVIQESPGISQQKARKASGSSAATEEKRKKNLFGLSFPKSKKEKCIPHEKATSTSTSNGHKGKPVLTVKDDCARGTKKIQTVSKEVQRHQDNYNKAKLSTSVISCPMESSVDYEEDMYRDAEEIEREKVLLVCGTDSSENTLSVAPEVDIMDYCKKEWRGNTSHAKCIRKGYEAVSQKFISIRRVRGDNYCAVRATLFQALTQAVQLPDWLHNEDIMLLPKKLIVKYDWITQWQLRQKWTRKVENLMDEIKECLMLLKRKWKHMSEMKTSADRQAACDELFRSEEDEYKLYEAVKFLMLNTAIKLYEDSEKGKDVPVFAWLLFARDTSSNPSQLMENHLNQLGHTGGLEQVEMFLLAYALQHTIQVYRLYKYSTDEFITLYPNDPDETWPVVTVITEDDRHYNIPVRMCEETSV